MYNEPDFNERINQRLRELVEEKTEQGYHWETISSILYDEFGVKLSADACRKRARRQLFDEEANYDKTLAAEPTPLDKIKIEKIKNRELLTQTDAMYRSLSREETLKEIAREAVQLLNINYPLLPAKSNSRRAECYCENNSALLLLSDWHYGIEIDCCKNSYNPEICKKRVAQLRDEVEKIVKKNNISRLYILNLGDMISGNIHLQLRINSRKDVITQTMEVTEIIANFLNQLSQFCPKIDYYSVLDNHSRIDPDKKCSLQLESFARLTPWFLSERFKGRNDIVIHENTVDPDIATFSIDNLSIVGVHGDKDKKDGAIKSLNAFLDMQIDILCSAHLHHFSADESTRTLLISTGSMMGTDTYAFNLRLDSAASQTLVTFKTKESKTVLDGIFKIELE